MSDEILYLKQDLLDPVISARMYSIFLMACHISYLNGAWRLAENDRINERRFRHKIGQYPIKEPSAQQVCERLRDALEDMDVPYVGEFWIRLGRQENLSIAKRSRPASQLVNVRIVPAPTFSSLLARGSGDPC